ncbi:anthocyanidin 5,3-O-glucosyltransferase-like isoform X2 [Miscanthus floridulus]|uniref:anthocyanidin 5,3-O-glucosyltransferase-like isoform X2 n=1 Tax=Miscanthus floridulus TaxID=154761 RepID=UPI0034584B88
MEKTTTLVLYPGFGVGHLSPMLELSKLLLRHGGGAALDVVVVLVQSPFGDPSFDDTVARAKAANTSVDFHVLPSPKLPPAPDGEQEQAHDHIARMFGFLRATNAPLRDFLLRSLSASSSSSRSRSVRCALVLDTFCAHALDVAAELAVPAYLFSSTGASSLAIFLALPGMRGTLGAAGFGELGDAVLTFAGVPPLKASELPQLIRDDGAACKASLGLASRMPEARGILLNSFESLEPRAVRALRDGLCVPGRDMPPVYCVGPLVSPGGDMDHGCLRWMDAQPDRSVVFLCFGSMGAFPKSQLKEMAVGLESSGQRFLWVVRSPRGPGEPADDLDVDLKVLLPDGFLERTRDRGLVVKSWAPQVDVLQHRAAGAFVTHCGWNSTLEGVTAGLPLLCWPLYAEQGLNKVFAVEEMRLGVEVRKSRVGDEDVVKAEEVEAKVRWVMEESDGARALRERAAAARDRAGEALAEGGPSHAAFLGFLEDLET